MNKRISIKAGDIEVEGQLNDSRIANMIWEALPFNSFGKLWGHEIYFTVPVSCCLEDGQEVVPNGSSILAARICVLYLFWVHSGKSGERNTTC